MIYLDIPPDTIEEITFQIDLRKLMVALSDFTLNKYGQISSENFETFLKDNSIDPDNGIKIDPEEFLRDQSVDDFLEDNNVGTDFMEWLPTFEFTLQEIVDIYIENQDELSMMKVNVTVVESYEIPEGKFADIYGNVAVFDSNHFVELIIEMLTDVMDTMSGILLPGAPDVIQSMGRVVLMNIGPIVAGKKLNINDFAMTIEGVLKN